MRARGARDEAEPAEPAAPPSAPPEHGSATLPRVANSARTSFQATGVRQHRDHAEGGERHRFTILLVTDEVLHPIGKVQPLLIGLNVPDQVESSLTGVILSRGSPTIGSHMEPTLRSITCRRGFRPQALSRGWNHGLERPQQLTYQGPQLRQILIVWPRESIDCPASAT